MESNDELSSDIIGDASPLTMESILKTVEIDEIGVMAEAMIFADSVKIGSRIKYDL